MGIQTWTVVTLCAVFLRLTHGNYTNVSRGSKLLFNQFPLAPLTIVQIPNEKCDAGDGRNGTCMGKLECWKKGGSKRGVCGQGFGVCCLMTATENGVAYGNNTLIYKSEFNEGVDITYTILRMNDKICQYRLDVVNLHLTEVTLKGSCTFDYMTINQDTKFKKVCGKTEGVHYYIDVLTPSVLFTFHTEGDISFNRKWEIYVSQYTCDMGAPEGCGQWYWGTTGKIEIWNNINPTPNQWFYLDDQVYAICIRWEARYCTITYYEKVRFQPNCDDIFERPGATILQAGCIVTPPSTSITYTLDEGLQYFYVQFSDNTNDHVGTTSNPFKNPSILYTQNPC